MNNPYKIEGPALISFSGGRSSAYMLYHIIQAHGGTLPKDVHVVFANTGLEVKETYDFIQECASRWNIEIIWLEWIPTEDRKDIKFKIVSHNEAARNGEPLKQLIQKRQYLPNPTQRICTYELKVKTMRRYMKSLYPESNKNDGWYNVVGLRGDEMRRVFSVKNTAHELGQMESLCPMADAKVSKYDVAKFWSENDFDLNLENVNGSTPLGNCSLCFLKGYPTLIGIMRKHPELAKPWIEMEDMEVEATGKCHIFRKDRPSYKKMLEISQTQGDLFDMPDEPTIPCTCTD